MKKKRNTDSNLWFSDETPISEAEIRSAAKRLKVEFPAGFIQVASKYNGGSPDRNIFDAGEREECVFEYLLKFPEGFWEFYNAVKKRLPKNIFPFAIDPFGNAICFDYRQCDSDSGPKIVFWDHEAPPESEDSICFLAESFVAFVDNSLYAI